MKKLLTLLLTIITLFSFSQGSFNVPVGYGSRQAADFQSRVIDSGGTYYPNIAAHQIDERKSYGLNPVFEFYPAASKTSVLYSQKPTDGTGDFTVTRASTANTVNEDMLIESKAANIARFDYSNGYPVSLTEPASTNLITYPISFDNSYYDLINATLEGDPSTASSV